MFGILVGGCLFVRLVRCLFLFVVGGFGCFGGAVLCCCLVCITVLLLIVLVVPCTLSVYMLSFILMFGFDL